ncbi:MAG: ImmA/IrrE family metallo-endopeptidase [Pseudomonadota bacterium]|nr:ImmA/IrrE family metallo-endopeptidase [Pseudomonadota bacterium]
MATTTFEKAKPSNLPKAIVAEFAEKVAEHLGYEPGSNMLSLLEQLGGRIKYKEFWDLHDVGADSITIFAPSDFEIYVSSRTSPERDRFTIAHEIGHYFLHYLFRRDMDEDFRNSNCGMQATRYGSSREEWEANWFAASFLMPKSEFKEKFREFEGDVDSIANFFRVSRAAAKIRSEVLGLA